MDLEYGPQYDDFRAEVVNFIKENENIKLSGPPRSESRIEWQQKLIDNGYFARSIPKEYGGYGGDMDIHPRRILRSMVTLPYFYVWCNCLCNRNDD